MISRASAVRRAHRHYICATAGIRPDSSRIVRHGLRPGAALRRESPPQARRIRSPVSDGRTEVTVRDFRAFVKATGYRTDAEKAGEARNWQSPGFPLRDRQPVVFMSLNDAKAYCQSIGARVPLESEWEYAARAGSTTYHYWGEEIDDRYLWYFNNTDQRPEAVGRKLPNAWGLYDVEGNAMEWVQRGPHSSITRDDAGSVRGGSYATCPDPIRPATVNASALSVSAPPSRASRTVPSAPTSAASTSASAARNKYTVAC